MFGDRSAIDAGADGVPGGRHAGLRRHGGGARARLGQAPRRRHRRVFRRRASDEQRSLRGSSVQGRSAPARLHHQALFGGRQRRRHEGPAPPADPGRHLRCRARSPISSSPAPRSRSASASARSSCCCRCSIAQKRSCSGCSVIAGGIVGYVGPELLHRPAHRQEQGRAPRRLPGFHGSPGGVRRFRPEHGGRARARRARARRHLSVALRQHPHDQSRDPRRPDA